MTNVVPINSSKPIDIKAAFPVGCKVRYKKAPRVFTVKGHLCIDTDHAPFPFCKLMLQDDDGAKLISKPEGFKRVVKRK